MGPWAHASGSGILNGPPTRVVWPIFDQGKKAYNNPTPLLFQKPKPSYYCLTLSFSGFFFLAAWKWTTESVSEGGCRRPHRSRWSSCLGRGAPRLFKSPKLSLLLLFLFLFLILLFIPRLPAPPPFPSTKTSPESPRSRSPLPGTPSLLLPLPLLSSSSNA